MYSSLLASDKKDAECVRAAVRGYGTASGGFEYFLEIEVFLNFCLHLLYNVGVAASVSDENSVGADVVPAA